MEECTFHPKISDFSGERGWEQFFYEMEKF